MELRLPINYTVYTQDLEATKNLLECKADPNIPNGSNKSVFDDIIYGRIDNLKLACQSGNFDMVKLLFEYGVKICKTDDYISSKNTNFNKELQFYMIDKVETIPEVTIYKTIRDGDLELLDYFLTKIDIDKLPLIDYLLNMAFIKEKDFNYEITKYLIEINAPYTLQHRYEIYDLEWKPELFDLFIENNNKGFYDKLILESVTNDICNYDSLKFLKKICEKAIYNDLFSDLIFKLIEYRSNGHVYKQCTIDAIKLMFENGADPNVKLSSNRYYWINLRSYYSRYIYINHFEKISYELIGLFLAWESHPNDKHKTFLQTYSGQTVEIPFPVNYLYNNFGVVDCIDSVKLTKIYQKLKKIKSFYEYYKELRDWCKNKDIYKLTMYKLFIKPKLHLNIDTVGYVLSFLNTKNKVKPLNNNSVTI